ncbi:FAA hydrolase family protein [Rhodovulum sp. 12E13]|uniref:fumarylacetoacetate hydrolase family protein n=1 Tax=Rhodovulum sp. 12E13 TaxID=2203891 RepID=UPI000E17D26C|nr:fumarylacetoacetate hydrolase family protein [Rhodovulum sp. 12E13]RDC72572.1 FAA hydrolase family protein [Rhodovulum sp. 12E13]
MRLVRYGEAGTEAPGMIDDSGTLRDLSGEVADIAGEALLPETLARLAALDAAALPAVEGAPRLGACVGRVGKLIGIGLNYADHAAEAGQPVPPEPVVFLKATSAICGPADDVILPPGADKTDWEVELGVVIGREARYVAEADALAHVAGYCVVNDVSDRGWQMDRAGQWTKGKSADTFAPLGPWLVTADAVRDPQARRLTLDIDGRRMQDGSTETMVYGVAHLVHYLSHVMSLQPGDVISTGTPPGVALGRADTPWLRPGQVMEAEVEGLGRQRNRIVAAPG